MNRLEVASVSPQQCLVTRRVDDASQTVGSCDGTRAAVQVPKPLHAYQCACWDNQATDNVRVPAIARLPARRQVHQRSQHCLPACYGAVRNDLDAQQGARTWYSHCDGITSALMPEMLMPAYMQHFRCASTTSRAMAAPAPALRVQRHSMGAGMSAPAEGLTKRRDSSKEVWC